MSSSTFLTSKKIFQLVHTAKELFLKYGVKRVSIEEICKKSSVSKVTFYKYFKNKKALAAHIRAELIEQCFKKFDEISAMEIQYPAKVDKMSKWRQKFFSKMNAEFIEEMFSDDTFKGRIRQRFLNNIIAAQKTGEIRQDLSPELIWLVTEKLNEIVSDGNWKTIFSNYRDYQQQMHNLFFLGVLSRKN